MPEFKDMLKYFRMREHLSQSELAEKIGVSSSTISMYEVGKREPDFETEEKIADFFNTDLNTLRGRDNETSILSEKDERDIAKDLESIMSKLDNKEDGPASYDGADIPDDDREMFAAQIEIMLRRLKAINKEKYNPNKNKK